MARREGDRPVPFPPRFALRTPLARKLIFRVHMLAGLLAGLFLVSAGLTGSVLVWRHELDALLHPGLLRVQPAAERVPLQGVVDAVRAAHAGSPPTRIEMPRAADATYEVRLSGEDPLEVYVDPYRGTLLGQRRTSETFTNALFEWHTRLLSGETGEWVVGSAGVILLVLVLTGVVVWWPGVRRLRDALTVRWSAGWKRANFDVHRAVGAWGVPFLTLAAITGTSLVFHDAYMAGLNRITASPPRPAPPPARGGPGPALPLDEQVARALRLFPDGQVTVVTLPKRAADPLTVRLKVPAELHPNGRNFVYLHPRTGAVLAVESALRAPAGTRAYNILYPIHIGRWGGLASRLLYSLLGLTPAILFASGCLMWWNRSGRRAWGRGKKPVRRPPQRERRAA